MSAPFNRQLETRASYLFHFYFMRALLQQRLKVGNNARVTGRSTGQA